MYVWKLNSPSLLIKLTKVLFMACFISDCRHFLGMEEWLSSSSLRPIISEKVTSSNATGLGAMLLKCSQRRI